MKLIYLFIPLLLLGCSAEKPLAEVTPADLPATVPGTSLDLPQASDVRNPEALKAYPAGRYEDPNDPGLMHESHVVYRSEQPPTWNLNPTVSTAVPLGPTVAVNNPAKETTSMTGELEQKVQQQNQLLQSTFEQNEKLTDELKKMQDDVAKTHEIVTANETLQKQVADLQTAMSKLQDELTQNRQQAPVVSVTPPKPAEKTGWLAWFLSFFSPPSQLTNPTKGKK